MPRRERETDGITTQDAAIIKGMLKRGDMQQWIVAYFGGTLNPARIADIKSGLTFRNIRPVPENQLPPQGPYLSGRKAHLALQALRGLREKIDEAIGHLTAQDNVVAIHQERWREILDRREQRGRRRR
jgi:hypothetical protein